MYTHSLTRNKGNISWQATQQRHMGPTWTQRWVCAAVNAILPLPNILHPQGSEGVSLQHHGVLPSKPPCTQDAVRRHVNARGGRPFARPPQINPNNPNHNSEKQSDSSHKRAVWYIQHGRPCTTNATKNQIATSTGDPYTTSKVGLPKRGSRSVHCATTEGEPARKQSN